MRQSSKGRLGSVAAFAAAALIASVVVAPEALAAPPSNDDFTSAEPITQVPFDDTTDVTDATSEAGEETSCGYGGHSVWYSYSAAENQKIVADTFGSDYDTNLGVFDGPPSQDSLVACNGDWHGNQSRLSFDAETAATYYFMITGNGGVLEFHVDLGIPPKNDDISNAKSIPAKLPFVHSEQTTEASLDLSDPNCSGRARSVWFEYQRPKKWAAKKIEMNTFGSNYDTTLSVYKGKPGNLEQIRCDDNTGGIRSKVKFVPEPGTKYYVMVAASRNSAGGDLVLKVKNAPVPFRYAFSVDPTGSVSEVTGVATVTGKITCNLAAKAYLEFSIRQKVGEHVVSSRVSKAIGCKDGTKSWSATAYSSRAYKSGDAGVWVEISVPSRDRKRLIKRIVQLLSCSRCI
ncbi:MAG: PPC domain-containing protein [Actinobacteria bacterium]|nr:PPC domain-containing protein [Actinomycetota bacterium]